jgi:hypothetical protein
MLATQSYVVKATLGPKTMTLGTRRAKVLDWIEKAPSLAQATTASNLERIDAFNVELKKPFKDGDKLAALEAEVAELELLM